MANISIDVADNEARQDLQDLEDYVDSAAFDKQSLSVTQNGTYTAPAGKAYSPVTVEVASGGDNMFYVTVTDNGQESYTIDKTATELYEAYASGAILMVKYIEYDSYLKLYYPNILQLQKMDYNNDTGIIDMDFIGFRLSDGFIYTVDVNISKVPNYDDNIYVEKVTINTENM